MKKLQERVAKFRDDRDWKQFHNPKNLSMSIAIEAAELMECFQWKNEKDIEKYINSKDIKNVNEEMADILIYLISLADTIKIDLLDEANKKLNKNAKKYPIEKAKGSYKKYTEFNKT